MRFKLSHTDHVYFPVLAFIAATFPLPIAYNSVGVILLLLVFLADYKNLRNNLDRYFSDKKNLLLLTIFVCLLVSVLYSEDKTMAQKVILTAIPLIVLPLSLTGISTITEKKIIILKKLFILSCFISSIIYMILAVGRSGLVDGSYKKETDPEHYLTILVGRLTYNPLSPSIHAIFFSMYIALAILTILFEIKKRSWFLNVIYSIVVFYFLIYLLLLTSATINFSLYSFIILLYYFQFSFKKWQHYLNFFFYLATGSAVTIYLLITKYAGAGSIGFYQFDNADINNKILLVFISLICFGLLAISLKLFLRRLHVYILPSLVMLLLLIVFIYRGNKNDPGDSKINNVSVRVKYGAAALHIIKKNPLFGIGIGDKKNAYILKKEELPEGALPQHAFNSHNQFFDFWLAAGIIPMICFIIYLFNVGKQAIRQRQIVYVALVYCFCLFCFIDAAMMVQRGQVFFLFFVWLYEHEYKSKSLKVIS
jgi:O-antigen ligase